MLRLFVVSKTQGFGYEFVSLKLTFQKHPNLFSYALISKIFLRQESAHLNVGERNLKIKAKIRIITSVFGTNLRSSMVDR